MAFPLHNNNQSLPSPSDRQTRATHSEARPGVSLIHRCHVSLTEHTLLPSRQNLVLRFFEPQQMAVVPPFTQNRMTISMRRYIFNF